MKQSLQLVMPYTQCKFSCPFCIARERRHNYQFKDLYTPIHTRNDYLTALKHLMLTDRYHTVVITGEADPTQNIMWVKDVIQVLNLVRTLHKLNFKIEIQIKDTSFNFIELFKLGLDVMAVSVSTMAQHRIAYMLAHKNPQYNIRPVYLLSKLLSNKLNKIDIDLSVFKQVTFKELQQTDSDSCNDWIKENEFVGRDELKDLMFAYKNDVSIMYDISCQDSKGRYQIFRVDASIYEAWEDATPLERRVPDVLLIH